MLKDAAPACRGRHADRDAGRNYGVVTGRCVVSESMAVRGAGPGACHLCHSPATVTERLGSAPSPA